MAITILNVIILLEITVCFYFNMRFALHMAQLSSYHNPTISLYVRNNKKNVYAPYKIFLVLPAFAMLAAGTTGIVLRILGVLILGWFAYVSRPKSAKKPFVVTARVKRLMVTCLALYSIGVIGLYFALPTLSALWAALFVWLVFSVVKIANVINIPVEKAVAKYYINDAKKILANSTDLTVIGITGSFGKTSTKYFLASILSQDFQTLMTPASYNTTLGVVRTIREQLNPTHRLFVVEMGARHAGEIKEICDIVHPKFGMITSIGEQHLETFGTLENIVRTKMEMANAVKEQGIVFFNVDSEAVRQNIPIQKSITYGIENNANYKAYNLSLNESGISFEVRAKNGETESFKTKLLGAHNVVNILGAIAVAHTCGMPLRNMVAPVRRLVAVPHRLEMKPAGDNIIIDDAYNSNPVGAKAALDALSLCQGMKVLVSPGMVELGTKESELNFAFGAQAADVCDYVCIVSKKTDIYDGLKSKNYPQEKIFVTDDVRTAINHALALQHNGKKYILLENDLPDNY